MRDLAEGVSGLVSIYVHSNISPNGLLMYDLAISGSCMTRWLMYNVYLAGISGLIAFVQSSAVKAGHTIQCSRHPLPP